MKNDPPSASGRATEGRRVLLVDASDRSRTLLAERLASLGFVVETAADGVEGAASALRSPPRAVIADLWLPGVSGVQLCRLLHAEPATAAVPVLLRGDADDRRNRFWAERAGAAHFLGKGRIGELVRALERAMSAPAPEDDFFLQIGDTGGIFDRIALHLDAALFESVIGSEVRALASASSPAMLFDLLSQFVSQIHTYRWLSLSSFGGFFGIHHPTGAAARSLAEAEAARGAPIDAPFLLEDDDASGEEEGPPPIDLPILFGHRELGRIALAPRESAEKEASSLLRVIAREVGGALRMTALVEESSRLAASDPLTRLMNRRAFVECGARELCRVERHGGGLGLGLLDVDRFKSVNDEHGHAVGDEVLCSVARTLNEVLRRSDVVARWGGEEFVFLLPTIEEEGIFAAAERVRRAIEDTPVPLRAGGELRLTASVGVTAWRAGDGLDAMVERADAAMYRAKGAGRNRVVGDFAASLPNGVATEAA